MTTFSAWPPSRRDPGMVDLLDIHQHGGGLDLTILPFDHVYVVAQPEPVSFQRAVVRFALPRAHRAIDEGYRPFRLQIPEAEPLAFVYFTRNSDLIREFIRMKPDVWHGFDLVHWLVPSANMCVDVISEVEPTLELARTSAA